MKRIVELFNYKNLLLKGAALIDHSNMNKRLFNVSPYINILLPNP